MTYEHCPRKDEVESYLREHKINDMFQNLTSLLFFHRPENPKQFLAEQLHLLKAARDEYSDPPSLFTEANAESIFNMLDPCEKNAVTLDRYQHALETLGIQQYDKKITEDPAELISKDVYMKEVKTGLKQLASTYKAVEH
uniref:EFCAB10 C-terminal EF-hand domain-containing protein n=1 Tax=Trichobilharzia regenti TaxID=157069 RepID=A0AA85K458_TRIRE|nr:unnamed protein product [Trichobilharzia regenti]